MGDINVLCARHLESSQQTYLRYVLCINISLLRMYINLLRATWVYIALKYALHKERSIIFHQFHIYIYELLVIEHFIDIINRCYIYDRALVDNVHITNYVS